MGNSRIGPTPVFTGTPTGTVQVYATNVSTTGQFSSGIVAIGGGDVAVNVAPGGSVSGGWQPDLTGRSSLFGLPVGLPAAVVLLVDWGSKLSLMTAASGHCPTALFSAIRRSSTTASLQASWNLLAATTASLTMARSI